MEFFDYQNFNESKKLQFKKPFITEINCEKYYFIPIRYKNRDIFVKTPKIVAPFDLNIYLSNSNENIYYYVLSMTDSDIDTNIEKFNLFLRKIETSIQLTVKKNLLKWGCEYAFNDLIFKSCIKDSDGIDLFRLKINPKITELYDEQGQFKDFDEIETLVTKQCHIISLIELNNIWIKSTEYGLTWKVHQMRVYPSTRPLGGISLLDENISIHNNIKIKIIEEHTFETSEIPIAPPPSAPSPPPMTPIRPRIPIGGVSMLPFLSSISGGNFNLKKVGDQQKSKQSSDDRPEISLNEILKIRERLRKS